MRHMLNSLFALFAFTLLSTPLFITPTTALAESAEEINAAVHRALNDLYKSTPGARALGESAAGILVFPEIIKGGFIVGGQYGEGALIKHGNIAGYYNSVAASYGLQAGVQKFGYALFFMDKDSLNYLSKSEGWEVGVGPSIVVLDQGAAKSMTTTTAQKGVYAFFFDQKGLMAGLGVQGSKISKIRPE